MTYHTADHSHFGRPKPLIRAGRHVRGLSVGDTLLLKLGGLVYRLNREDTARIEAYFGRSIGDLSRDDLERALLHLGIDDHTAAASDHSGHAIWKP